MRKLHTATILLATCLLASGASGLITQYIIAGISGQLLGSTLKQVAIVVGLMMLGFGFSAIIQNRVKSHLIGYFVAIECLLAIFSGYAPLILQWSYGSFYDHFTLFQYLIAFGVGSLVGLEIPLVMRINEKYVDSLGENLASTFSWDYIGAAAGSLVYIYLLSKTGLNEIAVITSGVNLGIAFSTFLYFYKATPKNEQTSNRKRILTFTTGVALLSLCGYLLFLAGINTKEWRNKLLIPLYNDTIMVAEKTPFQQLVVTHNQVNDDWRLFINGNLQFSSVDEYIYHENLVHPLVQLYSSTHSNPDSVLVLGGGDGMAVREIKKYGIKDITLVDLDAALTDLFKSDPLLKKLNSNSLDNVNLINGDAFQYIHDTKLDQDLIIIDFPDPNHIDLNKLYSLELYSKLYSQSKPTTMMVVQSTSPLHAKEAYLCIGRTLQAAGWQVLPYHDNVPTFGDWGWYLAWKPDSNITQNDVVSKLASLSNFSVDTTHLSPRKFLANTVFSKTVSSNRTTINTNNSPYIVNYYDKSSEIW